MTACFISDLHLQGDLSTFKIFCENYARNYEHIFILGDLFDTYLGDDLIDDYYIDIVNIISTLNCHSKVYVMYGNRDFLMGDEFCKRTHSTLITEPYEFHDIILMHGDSLVRDDWGYRIFKLLIRNPLSIALLKLLPKKQRIRLAHNIKQKANKSKRTKPLDIMDVNSNYCDKVMRAFTSKHLIHGHTHRPKIHHKEHYTRYVLPSWECHEENQPGGFVFNGEEITPIRFLK